MDEFTTETVKCEECGDHVDVDQVHSEDFGKTLCAYCCHNNSPGLYRPCCQFGAELMI